MLVCLLLIVVATYFIKGRDGSVSYLAIGDVFMDYIQAFYYFFDTAVFIAVVGGLYGALNKVPSYRNLVRKTASLVAEKKQLFVIVVTVVFALLSSLTGLNVLLLIFIPFVVSVILLLGYDKLVALSSTVVAVMAGFIGGVLVTIKDPSSQYAVSYVTFDKLVGLKSNWGCVFPKVLLLIIAVGLLVFYIINHIKKIEEGEEKDLLGKRDVFYVTIKDKLGKVVKEKDDTKIWPLLLMTCVLFVLLVLGFMPWNDLFGLTNFDKFHNWLTELKIGNYEVFTSLISSNIGAFGTWGSLGSFMMPVVLIALFIVILKFVTKVKFSDLLDGFVYGVKKMVPAVMLVILGYTLLVCAYNNGFMETIITNASKSFGDNVVVHALITIVGSITNVDTYYTAAGIISPIVSSLTDKANLSVYTIMFQSIYGLVQVCGPTSILLVVGLSYLEVPYSKWLKYIWRYVLGLLISILIVLMIVSLL